MNLHAQLHKYKIGVCNGRYSNTRHPEKEKAKTITTIKSEQNSTVTKWMVITLKLFMYTIPYVLFSIYHDTNHLSCIILCCPVSLFVSKMWIFFRIAAIPFYHDAFLKTIHHLHQNVWTGCNIKRERKTPTRQTIDDSVFMIYYSFTEATKKKT